MKIISHLQSRIRTNQEQTEYLVGTDLLENLHKIPYFTKYRFPQIFLLSDKTVFKFYGHKLLSSLKKIGSQIAISIVSPGEKSKDLRLLPKIVQPFFQTKISRNSCLISLGGGVVTDLGGFLASILLRGIASIHCPTTLLAQVDAAIGGKNGVNLWISKNLMYKNMIGVIKQPILVISDLGTLKTLPRKEYLNGLGEIAKYWVGWGKPNQTQILKLNFQEEKSQQNAAKIISLCQEIKIKTIEKDPFDTRCLRAKLNLGHTFGHAIESASKGFLSHGESVSIGLVAAAKISLLKKLCQKATYEKIISFLESLKLPTRLPAFMFQNIETKKETIQFLKSALSFDKKGGTFVLIREIGKLKTGIFVEREIIDQIIETLFL